MPYEKILELVEAKKLDISTINLAKITGDFINYVQKIEKSQQIEPGLLANFITVAAKLLLIKSKTLIPSLTLTDEEESDIKELEERLRIYQQYKEAGANLNKFWQTAQRHYQRPHLANQQIGFYPPAKLNAKQLLRIIQQLSSFQEKKFLESKIIKTKLISVKEKIEELIGRLTSGGKKFSQLTANSSRPEIVAFFLAILQLLKDQIIEADQINSNNDLWIKRI